MKYKIKIENPCKQDWSKLKSAVGCKGGKFCLLCSKIVVSLLLIAGIQSANAQVRKYKTTPTPQTTQNIAKNNVVTKKAAGSGKKIIQGWVRNKNGSVIPYATVFLKNANMNVKTDSSGYFKMLIPTNLIKDTITLVAAAEGYSNNEYKIPKKQIQLKQELALKPNDMIVTVEVKGGSRKSKLFRRYSSDEQASATKRKWWGFRKKN